MRNLRTSVRLTTLPVRTSRASGRAAVAPRPQPAIVTGRAADRGRLEPPAAE